MCTLMHVGGDQAILDDVEELNCLYLVHTFVEMRDQEVFEFDESG